MVNKKVDVKWTTTNEVNNTYFNVHQSVDGRVFKTIGKVDAYKLPSGTNYYMFTDVNPTEGISYYRLEQVDKDGKTELFTTEIITNSEKTKPNFQVVSNESSNNVEVLITSSDAITGTINIFDVNGRKLATKKVEANNGSSKFIIELPFVAKGIFMGTFISTTGDLLTSKFVK